MKNTRPNRAGKPKRVDLIPEEFENLIEDQGVFVKITPVLVCPNKTDLYDTNHKLDCPLCEGKQYIDVTEKSFCEWVFIQSIKLDKQFDVQGIWDIKDARISTKAHVRLYYWYKVEMLDFENIFNELVERKAGDRDKLRYEATKSCETPFIVVDKQRNFYEHQTDFKIDGRDIVWTGLNRPAQGELYTISYPMHPTFRVLELMNENRNYYNVTTKGKEPINLPQHAVLRLDYLMKMGSLEERG
jgi:hypothetical protein